MLAAPDQQTWSGRRDHALLLLAVQTGLRLSELTGLRREDLHIDAGAHVRVFGKGRNYDDLGNMRSSAPRRLVCPSAMGFPRLPPVVDCA